MMKKVESDKTLKTLRKSTIAKASKSAFFNYESPALTAELWAHIIPSSRYFARLRVRGKLIWKSPVRNVP
jgi:hypothetical protein